MRSAIDELKARVKLSGISVVMISHEGAKDIVSEIDALQARVAELEAEKWNAQIAEGALASVEQERDIYRDEADLCRRKLEMSELAAYANGRRIALEERDRLLGRVDELEAKFAELVHYPDCWDTVAYPELQNALDNIAADYHGCTVCAEKALARIKAEAVREFADQTGDHYVINMAIDYNKANQIEGGT